MDRPPTSAPGTDLDRLVVIAGTFHDLPTDDREHLADHLATLRDGVAERLLLHTCHRAELLAVLDSGEQDVALPAVRGADAVERVLTVVAGLDSAVVAEEQLLGQVRDTYTAALARHETGPILNELMRRALRFGKHVRSSALPGGDRSLAQRALAWIAGHGAHETALIVGTGIVAREVAAGLAAAGTRCTVASRSAERAEQLANMLPGGPHRGMLLDSAFETGAETGADPGVIVLATRTAGPLLRSSRSRGLVVDLCAPSAVDPALRPVLGARLVDLDRLGHATNALPAAVERRLRAELADERDRFVAWLAERTATGRIVELRSAAEDARRRHLDRLRGHGDLAEDQLAEVERMTIALVNELLHDQTVRLRRQAQAR
ncbi:MAG TPA: hypothetical protein VFN14_05875 [Candidatus Limnocylindria bacterium]|jgi:glutamyl-tRNA reductase|nr:hypothetical protein [Candidatus Limnocylindria bacterium]